MITTWATEISPTPQEKGLRLIRKTPRTTSARSNSRSDLTMTGFGVVTPATTRTLGRRASRSANSTGIFVKLGSSPKSTRHPKEQDDSGKGPSPAPFFSSRLV
jgi:hypothetical protein